MSFAALAALAVVLLGLHGVTRWIGAGLLALLAATALRQHKEARRSSLRACDEAVRANVQRLQDLGSLQGALANELNNPLAAIKMLAGLMEIEPACASARLPVLKEQVGRMQRTLEELLGFSRPLTPLAMERFDLRALARQVAFLHQGRAAARRVELDVAPGAPVELSGDAAKLKQALMSLVDNAIEASPEGATVSLTVDGDAAQARVAVLDQGAGIAADQLARVMLAGVTTKPHGSGLGLTIARTIVQQHRGTLRLANRDDGGLAATIELPRDAA